MKRPRALRIEIISTIVEGIKKAHNDALEGDNWKEERMGKTLVFEQTTKG